ncbi:hypothetical protein TRFO_23288 [Tritrichomonas foetus]|uniref:Uncharacterized protein n=1 Tax=Tritrichomonas foetus TaxID=1144522 RepID=A0A1J4K9S1_9EUKA|nr:hypothetical protein TRFO_23288 [Tritrichomonas foetus]|eukprot:OHT08217.1 hypothetical protein TRFO_23288 [Tritrichomonas foetus]
MILCLPLFLSFARSYIGASYCVCRKKYIDCESVCDGLKVLSFSQTSIETVLQKKSKDILFLVAGTMKNDTDYQPEFNLTSFAHVNFQIKSLDPNRRETIQLKPGHVDTNLTHYFQNIDINLDKKGVYDFYNLTLRQSSITSSTSGLVELEQDYLDIDFQSLHDIAPSIDFSPPTSGAFLICNEDINKVEFWSDHHLIFASSKSEAHFDFSQIERHGESIIQLSSRRINFTFNSPPTSEDYFPNITFKMMKTCHVFINEDQFNDDLMYIEKITFDHGRRGLYIDSRNGTIPPTFNHIGTGPYLKNDEKVLFLNKYCLCENEKCIFYCQHQKIVPFGQIDRTIIGNPHKTLEYLIVNSEATKKPIFDLEHFGGRNLTVTGRNNLQHIEVIGDGTDDVGFHTYSSLTIHSKTNFLFPDVILKAVDFSYEGKEKAALNSTKLSLDFTTLKNANSQDVKIIPTSEGVELHTTNIIKTELSMKILSPTEIEINDVVVSILNHTNLYLYCSGAVNLAISESFPKKVSAVPKIRIYAEGDKSTINFVGTWPTELNQLTAKIVVIHDNNPCFVTGDYDGKKYKFQPPLIAHEGTGAFFENGVLSNFKSKYCLCEGSNCEEKCQPIGPVIPFDETSISKTAIGNPTRLIEYVVFNSAAEKRPFFGLHDYTQRSFLVTSGEHRQYISIEGAKEDFETTSSVSHIFRDVNIMFANPGFYSFNNAEYDNCEFSKSSNDNKENYLVHQDGMTSDLDSLFSLDKLGLLSPCSLYLTVNGDHELTKIRIDDSEKVTLFKGEDKSVTVDLSGLLDSIPTFISHLGQSDDNPLVVQWNAHDTINNHDMIPQMRIDVSGTDGDDAYVQFIGRKWTDDFHNISERVTVVHGQVDIHILTKLKQDGSYSGQPPHVALVGDADYYINDVKQVSVFAPGNHQFSDDDEDEKSSIVKYVLIGLGVAAAVVAFIIFMRRPRGDTEMPKMRMAPEHDNEEDDQLANFLNTDDDEENPNN